MFLLKKNFKLGFLHNLELDSSDLPSENDETEPWGITNCIPKLVNPQLRSEYENYGKMLFTDFSY